MMRRLILILGSMVLAAIAFLIYMLWQSPTGSGTTAVDPHLTPIPNHDAIGVEGDVIGPPDHHDDTPPTGSTENLSNFNDGDGPMEPENVSVLPKLSNEREAQRMLQRVYPPSLRDAGVAGHTVVTLIVDRQGNVEPGSMRVLESYDCAVRTQASTSVAARTSKNPAHHATTSGASGADSISSPASAAHDRRGAQPATSRAVRYATVPCKTTFKR